MAAPVGRSSTAELHLAALSADSGRRRAGRPGCRSRWAPWARPTQPAVAGACLMQRRAIPGLELQLPEHLCCQALICQVPAPVLLPRSSEATPLLPCSAAWVAQPQGQHGAQAHGAGRLPGLAAAQLLVPGAAAGRSPEQGLHRGRGFQGRHPARHPHLPLEPARSQACMAWSSSSPGPLTPRVQEMINDTELARQMELPPSQVTGRPACCCGCAAARSCALHQRGRGQLTLRPHATMPP